MKHPKYAVIAGKAVVRIGHRHFAIPRVTGLAQQVSEQTNLRGNWNRIDEQPRGARLIANHRR